MDVAAVLGLHTMIEVPLDAERLLRWRGLRALRTELAEFARHFAGGRD